MKKNMLCLLLSLCLILPTLASEIAVTGTGIIKAKADIAYVMIGVERTEPTATTAQQIVANKMNNVLASLKKLGLSQDKLETSDFDLQARYEYQGGKRTFIGYTASNTIKVTLDDLAQVGKTIDTAIAAGANNINDVSFSVKEPAPYKKSALEKAFHAAKEKAEVIAGAAGLKLAKIKTIQEASAYVATDSFRAYKAESGAANTPIIPGKVEVRGSLTVIYECN